MDEHIEARPTWDCQVCEQPWPCEFAREQLGRDMQPTELRMHMWMRLEAAAEDRAGGDAPDLFRRFFAWTPR
jgi:hypothetical protein